MWKFRDQARQEELRVANETPEILGTKISQY